MEATEKKVQERAILVGLNRGIAAEFFQEAVQILRELI